MPADPDYVRLARLEAKVTEESTGIYTRLKEDGLESVWKRMQRLGKGGMGEVFCEECIDGGSKGSVRAVKMIQKPNGLVASKIDFSKELQAIARFSQPQYQHSFVRSFGWYDTDDTVLIAMEYVENGDLQRHVGYPIAEAEMQLIASQVLEGLAAMHSLGYAHRDLKPANLLVYNPGPQWHVKIADFGLSKRVVEGLTSLRTQGGTPGFTAPEVMGLLDDDSEEDEPGDSKPSYTSAVDVWALGVISFVMLTGELPFLASDIRPLKRYVKGKQPFPSGVLATRGISDEGRAWIEKCMAPLPRDRPNAGFSRQHRWPMGPTQLPFVGTPAPKPLVIRSPPSARWTTQDSGWQTVTQLPAHNNCGLVRTWQEVDQFQHAVGRVDAVRFSPDGRLLASVVKGKIRIWHVAEGKEMWNYGTAESWFNDVAFSPNGQLLASVDLKWRNGTGSFSQPVFRLWDTEKWRESARLEGSADSQDTASKVAFSPDGRLVAMSTVESDDDDCILSGSIGLWDIAKKREIRRLYCAKKDWVPCTPPAFSPDGRLLVSIATKSGRSFGNIGTVVLWEVASGIEVGRFKVDKHNWTSIWCTEFSPDGRLLALGGLEWIVKGKTCSAIISLWDVATWTETKRLKATETDGLSAGVLAISFSPDAQFLVSGSMILEKKRVQDGPQNGSLKIWDIMKGSVVKQLKGAKSNMRPVNSVAFSPDGRMLASGEDEELDSRQPAVRLWAAAS